MKNSSCFLNEEFSFLSCIGLVNDTTNLLYYHALLIARYHIYFSRQKGLNPSWELFFETILNCLDYERRYAIKTGILRKFNAKWGAFIRENDLYSLFSLSRCTENSNRANSLEALLTILGVQSVNVRSACVCACVCKSYFGYSVLWIWSVK